MDRLAGVLGGIRVSTVYETKPLYVAEQPSFLNIVVFGKTSLSPQSLLSCCLGIEQAMGRNRKDPVPKGPRIVDLDILLYGDRVVHTPTLEIPHPSMTERQFVLVPLLELEPDLEDPKTGEPYARSLAGLEDQGVYIFGPWEYTQGAPTDHEHRQSKLFRRGQADLQGGQL